MLRSLGCRPHGKFLWTRRRAAAGIDSAFGFFLLGHNLLKNLGSDAKALAASRLPEWVQRTKLPPKSSDNSSCQFIIQRSRHEHGSEAQSGRRSVGRGFGNPPERESLGQERSGRFLRFGDGGSGERRGRGGQEG